MERAIEILNILDREMGTDFVYYLDHENPWQLLIATILSAQCTDERVNIVTKDLFERYKTMESLANADINEVEKYIYSTGFYKNKAKSIIGASKMLVDKYNGEVPGKLEELIQLPGVGRKTANVVLGTVFKEASIVVDTHVMRISTRLGLTNEKSPEKIEYDLMEKLPKDRWRLYNIQIIAFGRQTCRARSPKCEGCPLQEYCFYYRDTYIKKTPI